MLNFQGKRFEDSYTVEIAGRPEIVFHLFCPEREKEWMDGWSYDMIYSKTGSAELGCVFKTNQPPEGETYWIASGYVPNTLAEYTRVVPDLLVAVFTMRLSPKGGAATTLDVTHTITGLSERGNQYITQQEAAFRQNRHWLKTVLDHFLETGSMLRMPMPT